eukprot:m51a1_g13419 hypothetical protein (154) ;mRNA; f:11-630
MLPPATPRLLRFHAAKPKTVLALGCFELRNASSPVEAHGHGAFAYTRGLSGIAASLGDLASSAVWLHPSFDTDGEKPTEVPDVSELFGGEYTVVKRNLHGCWHMYHNKHAWRESKNGLEPPQKPKKKPGNAAKPKKPARPAEPAAAAEQNQGQ